MVTQTCAGCCVDGWRRTFKLWVSNVIEERALSDMDGGKFVFYWNVNITKPKYYEFENYVVDVANNMYLIVC